MRASPTRTCCRSRTSALIKAAQRFDGGRGVRFSTYATAIVDGELRHHLRDSLLMRQPRWVKKVYQQIQDKSNELMHKLGRPPRWPSSPRR